LNTKARRPARVYLPTARAGVQFVIQSKDFCCCGVLAKLAEEMLKMLRTCPHGGTTSLS
jgi:hypothetical protein